MSIYIGILILILMFQIIGTVLAFYFKSDLVTKGKSIMYNTAAEFQSDSEESAQQLETFINDHLTVTMYISLVSLGVQIMALVFSVWYKDSLKANNENYNLLEKDGYK